MCKIGEDTISPLEVPIFVDEEQHGRDYPKPQPNFAKPKWRELQDNHKKGGATWQNKKGVKNRK